MIISEIKNFFFVSQVLAFGYTKQTSKNVVGTTFKQQAKQDEAQTWSKLSNVKAGLKKCVF